MILFYIYVIPFKLMSTGSYYVLLHTDLPGFEASPEVILQWWSTTAFIQLTQQNGITLNANLMQQGNFIDVFLARHVPGTYAHHQEHWMLSCSYMVFCIKFLDGWWSWEPLRRSCVRCGWCRATHTTPYAPSIKTCVAKNVFYCGL